MKSKVFRACLDVLLCYVWYRVSWKCHALVHENELEMQGLNNKIYSVVFAKNGLIIKNVKP